MVRVRVVCLCVLMLFGGIRCGEPAGGEDFLTALLKGPKVEIEEPSFLELSFQGPIGDGPSSNPFVALSSQGPASLWDIRGALKAAASDSRILGIKIEVDGAQLGFGALEEIAGLMDEFRKSKKPVFAYLRGDFVADGDYWLGLCANRIYVPAASGLMVNGLRAEVTFWRGTLDKLGIVPHVLMFKQYKSAGEPYSRTSMSDAFRESLTAVLSDLEDRLAQRISERRGLPPVQVRAGMALGIMTTQEALQTGWIDETGSREAVENALIQATGAEGYHGIGVKKFLRAVEDGSSGASSALAKALGGRTSPTIALIFADGPIVAQEKGDPFESLMGGESMIYGLETARVIDEAAAADDVKAIVFRVDSPGGSAVGSDHVYQAIRRAQAKGKKVVVSMASVAGSGGYWISMGADRIVAQPVTITGSIGVVASQFDVRGFYEWIGAHVDTVALSKGAGVASSVEDFDAAREERWTAWMSLVYEDFKKHVAQGRGLSVEQVEERAKGRIWSGTDALGLKLVDRLGGLDVAIEEACALAKIQDPKTATIELYPKHNALDELFEGLLARSASAQEDALASLRAITPAVLQKLSTPRILVQIPDIRLD